MAVKDRAKASTDAPPTDNRTNHLKWVELVF